MAERTVSSGGIDSHTEITQALSTKLSSLNLQIPTLSAVAMKGDEKLVDSFLSETVPVGGDPAEVKRSQLYIASFWGFSDVVSSLLESGTEVNHQNKATLWTPLHAATFQEHGKVVMLLLQKNANAELKDSEGRSAKDFASASQKIWPHFAALGLTRTPKGELVAKGIVRKVDQAHDDRQPSAELRDLRMASFSRPGSAYVVQPPHGGGHKTHLDSRAMAACLSGDVLAAADPKQPPIGSPKGVSPRPLLGIWRS